jgi:hypothetical protein
MTANGYGPYPHGDVIGFVADVAQPDVMRQIMG